MTSVIPSEITFVFYYHCGKKAVGECTDKMEVKEHMINMIYVDLEMQIIGVTK